MNYTAFLQLQAETGYQIINGDGQYPGYKNLAHALQFNAGFDHLEKRSQKGITCGKFLVKAVVAGGDQLVGKIVVLVYATNEAIGKIYGFQSGTK
nr:hypothetical protein [uncultured Desulfobacter sp.]